MAEPGATVAAEGAANQNEQQRGGHSWLQTVLQIVAMHFLFRTFFGRGKTQTRNVTDPETGKIIPPLRNAYTTRDNFSVCMVLSSKRVLSPHELVSHLLFDKDVFSNDISDEEFIHFVWGIKGLQYKTGTTFMNGPLKDSNWNFEAPEFYSPRRLEIRNIISDNSSSNNPNLILEGRRRDASVGKWMRKIINKNGPDLETDFEFELSPEVLNLLVEHSVTEISNFEENDLKASMISDDDEIEPLDRPRQMINSFSDKIKMMVNSRNRNPKMRINVFLHAMIIPDSATVSGVSLFDSLSEIKETRRDKRKTLMRDGSNLTRDSEPEIELFNSDQLYKIVSSSIPLLEISKPFKKAEHNLLDNQNDEDENGDFVLHWKSKVDIRFVTDSSNHSLGEVLRNPLFKNTMSTRSDLAVYTPPLSVSDFWMLEKDYIIVNKTLLNFDDRNYQDRQKRSATDKGGYSGRYAVLPLSLSFNLQPSWIWMAVSQLQAVFDPNVPKEGIASIHSMSHSKRDVFMLKRILIDTNPFFLLFSVLFMLTHSIFSMLAFKNEVHFWKNTNSMEGLSALSVVSSFVCEIIIGLYLLDSDTSWLILFEIFIGCAISGWKLTKAIKIEVTKTFPFVHFGDKMNYAESKTKEYDRTAIKFMSSLLFPCFIGYILYSLKYKQFKSWYSFVVSSLAGGVYTFGFIMMTPQLYINYKLKSVDHLPWRALVYRSLNTFVDDVSAFIIDMPWLHRLATFRDDIVFLVYVYQRWIYKIDKTRNPYNDNVTDKDKDKDKVQIKDKDKDQVKTIDTDQGSKDKIEEIINDEKMKSSGTNESNTKEENLRKRNVHTTDEKNKKNKITFLN